jgi:hypothetical protein
LATNDFSLEKKGYQVEEREVRTKTVRRYKEELTFWKTSDSTSDYIENKRAMRTHVLDRVEEGSGQDVENLKASGRGRDTHFLSNEEGGASRKETQKCRRVGGTYKLKRVRMRRKCEQLKGTHILDSALGGTKLGHWMKENEIMGGTHVLSNAEGS